MTKEEMLEKRRHIVGNQLMPVLSDTIYNLMDEYAKAISIEFMHFCLLNSYLSSDESGRVQLDYSYCHEPQFESVASEIFLKFIEQQAKDK